MEHRVDHSIAEVAHMLDMSESTVRRWLSDHRLTASHSGSGLRVDAGSVETERQRRLALLGVPPAAVMASHHNSPSAVGRGDAPALSEQLDEACAEVERLRHVISTLLISSRAHLDAIREMTAPVTPDN